MKILFILFSLDAGGVTYATEVLADEMVKMGHSVGMLSLTNNDKKKKIIENNGFKVTTFGHQGLGLKTFNVSFFQLAAYFIKNRDIEALIIASAYPGIIATFAARLTLHKAKILINYHTHISHYAANEPSYKRLILSLGKYILRLADVNANVSQEASRDTEHYFGIRHVETLYNPLLPYHEAPYEHRWLNNPDVIPIVTCARLTEVKDFPLMFDSFKLMLDYEPRYRLIVIGDGELRQKLQHYAIKLGIEEQIDFTGWISEPRPVMAQCRFFWLTSKYEGFGIVLLQALSAGIPCVSVDCPCGPREALEGGKYGLLIESRNPETIAIGTHQFAQLPKHPPEFYQQRAKDFLPEKTTAEYLKSLGFTNTSI